MTFFHLSDLHLGKRLAEFSLLEDQKCILWQILEAARLKCPDALIIAGDIYDKAQPSAEAVALFDDFLFEAASAIPHIVIISGNHDSPERLCFGSRLMNMSGVVISPVFAGKVTPVTLDDEYGKVDIWPLPFLRASAAARFFPDRELLSANDAVSAALGVMEIDKSRRNVLVCHQFISGAALCDSEDSSVGGTDAVDASLLGAFDYAALGHIHGPQDIAGGRIRYCGTPLKYSLSEIKHKKSLTTVTLGVKGEVAVETLPLVPMRDMRALVGSFRDFTENHTANSDDGDYISITLTDELEIPDAAAELRKIYPNLMRLDYDNTRERADSILISEKTSELSPFTLCGNFYLAQNGGEISKQQSEYLSRLIGEIWGDL